MWVGLLSTALRPKLDEAPMPPDRVREALDSLRHSMETRMHDMEDSIRELTRETGHHRGTLDGLHERIEKVAERVHTHGNRLQVLLSESDLRQKDGHHKDDYVTWKEANRIIVASVGLAGGLFAAITWVMSLLGGAG